eukprot:TRINITY_DN30186_c0_g1_i1.p1 TRINITY_DN30186_c0_g1~~TRINITY_DN30186_c0_g1_i1.p1  ORF type:complete len:277 (+),score=5.74 TRINITY_DN30186_c0_g1_i1:39-869(+)
MAAVVVTSVGGGIWVQTVTSKSRSLRRTSASSPVVFQTVSANSNRMGPRQCFSYASFTPSTDGTAFLGGEHISEFRSLRARVASQSVSPLGHVSRRQLTTRSAGQDSDVPAFQGFPPMQTKPAFYWRLLALIPYIMPLAMGFGHSDTAYTVFPFLESYELLAEPFHTNVIMNLPGWWAITYFFTAYLGVVRNNRFPHFLRFHVIMGMLLEILMQVIGTVNDWLPSSFYWGRISAHVWVVITVMYLFTVIECVLCALRGMYADVPFIADAAYFQIPY